MLLVRSRRLGRNIKNEGSADEGGGLRCVPGFGSSPASYSGLTLRREYRRSAMVLYSAFADQP